MNDETENAIEELKCLFENLYDNKDDESYDRLQSHLNYLGALADQVVVED